jgi:hypothetical protein
MEPQGRGSAEEPRIVQRHDQGVSDPCEGSENLTFLYRLRLVSYSLLHLRSSWKVNPASFISTEFSEVRRA